MASIHQIALLDAANKIERNQGKAERPIISKKKDISDGVADYRAADAHNKEMLALKAKSNENRKTLGNLSAAIEAAKKLQELYQQYKNLDSTAQTDDKEAFEVAGKLFADAISKYIPTSSAPTTTSSAPTKIELNFYKGPNSGSNTKAEFTLPALDSNTIFGSGGGDEAYKALRTLEFAKNTMDSIIELEAAEARIHKDAHNARSKFNAQEQAEASIEISEDRARKSAIMQMLKQSIQEEKSYQMLIAKIVSE